LNVSNSSFPGPSYFKFTIKWLGERFKLKWKKTNLKLSDTSYAYILVIPALLIISLVAIYPVINAFWTSLHDVKLNNPVKSSISHDYGIQIEQYLDSIPLLKRTIESELNQAENNEIKREISVINQDINETIELLETDATFVDQSEEVNDLLLDIKPIPTELKTHRLNKSTAKKYEMQIEKIKDEITSLANQNVFEHSHELNNLAERLENTFVKPNFVGLKNYQKYLTDNRMWKSLSNTLIFTLITVSLEMVIGFGLAILMNKHFFARGFVRASILIPWAIPTAVIAMMWKYLYDGQNGIVSYIFSFIKIIPDMSYFLSTKIGAMAAIVIADVWKTTPYVALLLLAGLLTIPTEYYEAAQVDGANKFHQLFKITLPLMKSAILVAVLFRVLDAFRVFDLIYVLTGGGPANSTEAISVYAYKVMFAEMNFGEGNTLAVIVFICISIISMIFVKLLGSDILERK